jgi:hypothetical protein
MNRWVRSAAILLVLATVACGDTSSESPLAPAGPRLDNGLIVVGNGTQPPPTSASSDTTKTTERNGLIVVGN